ncbi:MAG: PQQ-dependent sugar dehydrogenase [Pseudomonadota bacterium]
MDITKRLALAATLSISLPILAAPPPCTLDNLPRDFPEIRLQPITGEFDEPIGIANAGDGSNRLFIIEQRGVIRVWKNGADSKKPFLDISDRVSAGGEMGLLGLAFHPQFKRNGRFFVNYTTRDGGRRTVISEFTVEPGADAADSRSERVLLTFEQPYSNHNGGQMAFGPDNMLYIATGDGGAANDPHGNGQSLTTLLGKILRINADARDASRPYAIPKDNPFVNTQNAAPEIWAYGLRNPWRFSFDPVTGRLYAGDVGQNAREEIDVIEKGKNYGWNIMEGSICTPGVNPRCDKQGLELPIAEYPRSEGISVIGGYVYRGRAIPDLCGAYLYADYGSGKIFALRNDGSPAKPQTLLNTRHSITSFGEDEQRELYISDHAGAILKIVP